MLSLLSHVLHHSTISVETMRNLIPFRILGSFLLAFCLHFLNLLLTRSVIKTAYAPLVASLVKMTKTAIPTTRNWRCFWRFSFSARVARLANTVFFVPIRTFVTSTVTSTRTCQPLALHPLSFQISLVGSALLAPKDNNAIGRFPFD